MSIVSESIVEYDVVFVWFGGNGKPKIERDKRSFDLRWIAAAGPAANEYGEFTDVWPCGSGNAIMIDTKYEDFMPLWVAARGL